LPIEAAMTARHEFCRLRARLAAVVAFMQISSLREYYGFGLRSHLAVLDARTTNAVPALYVPEKLNRGERQITHPRRITLARRDARPAP
jgi:hypothetical protein